MPGYKRKYNFSCPALSVDWCIPVIYLIKCQSARGHASCQHGHTVTSHDLHGFISGRPGLCAAAAAAKTTRIPVKTFTKATARELSESVISRIDEGRATRCIIPAATSEAKKKISKCAFVCFASRETTSRAGSSAQDELWCPVRRPSLFSPTCVHLRLPHCCDKSRHQRRDTFHDIIYATFPTVRQFLIRAVNLHLSPSRRTRTHERLQQHACVAHILIEHLSL